MDQCDLDPPIAGRAGHAMTTLDGKIVVCGGHTTMETTRCLASVEVYSLEHNQWTYISPMRHDCCAMSPVGKRNCYPPKTIIYFQQIERYAEVDCHVTYFRYFHITF